MSESKGLKNGHLAFVNEYFLCNMNATDAYANTHPKASRESARRLASQLLTNVDIQEEIQRRLKEKQLSVDEVLARLGDMARADMRDFIKPIDVGGGRTVIMVDLGKALEEGKTHLIKKTKYNAQGGLEIELHDSQAALLNIGRHHGLFTDKIEVKLAKELEGILGTIEGVLDADSYQRVLQAIIGSSEGSTEETQSDSTS